MKTFFLRWTAFAMIMVAAAVSYSPVALAQTAPTSLDPALLYQNCNTDGGLLGLSGGDEAKTKYPIVLVSGLAGAAPNFLVPGVKYWYQIPEELCRKGATVYVASMPAVNDNYVRGEELLRQVKLLLATLKVDKVNLIGHSMGGWSVRYVAATFPEGVASVTTIASPHKGSEFGAFFLNNGPVVLLLGETAFNLIGELDNMADGTTYPVSANAAIHQISPAGMAAFNAAFPSAGISTAPCAGVDEDTGTRGEIDKRTGTDGGHYVQRLYSWTGNAPAPFGSIDTASNALMLTTSLMMLNQGAGKNDGLAGVCSSRFGKVIGTYGWNHFNEINQLFGLVPLFEANPLTVIVNHANRLKLAGL
ncbi:MAG: triacylglycerol lipase [Pseudomonadota bacterium]